MTTAPSSNRIATLDAARFLAAIGVVWIHVCQTPQTANLGAIGRFAVPFFAAAAGYFLVQSLHRKTDLSLKHFVASKFTRLYVPFLAWSGIYLVFKLTKKVLLNDSETVIPGIEVLYEGGAYHLWFIPYLIAASIVVRWMAQQFSKSTNQQHNLIIFVAAIGLALALILRIWPPSESTFSFMMMTTPALLWGCALGWLQITAKHPSEKPCLQSQSPIFTTTFLVLFLVASLPTISSGRSPLMENAAGVALLLAAIYSGLLTGLPKSLVKPINVAANLGQVSLGIYFSHLLFVKIGEALLSRWSPNYGLAMALFITVIVVIAATICSQMAAKHRFTRWLVA